MADVDIDSFGEHESRTEEPTDENIPLIPVTPGRSTWEPEREQEMSFGSRGEILHKEYLVGEIYELIGNTQALHGLAPKCEMLNMHEIVDKPTNNYITLLSFENGTN